VREAVERLDKERLKVFICGPWPFVEDMVKNLYSCGITQDKINYEKWEKNLLPLKGQKNVTPEKKL
jgi:ferredoxin-NADP reductase